MSDGDLREPSPPPAEASADTVACPECQQAVTRPALAAHLRHAHDVHLFRGVRRPLPEHLAALVDALLAPEPDAEAWRELQALAVELHGARANPFLAEQFRLGLRRLSADRSGAVRALAALLAKTISPQLLATLAADESQPVRLLALATLARRDGPPDPALHQSFRTLLHDRRLPEKAQLTVLLAALAGLGPADPLADQLLDAFLHGLSKARAVERLRQIEQRVGPRPALDARRARLEEQVRMACPRCPRQLRKSEMIHHLWDEHRLVLDGRRVRDPWAVVEDWAENARVGPPPASGETPEAGRRRYREHRAEMIRRCRTAGERLDPENGPLRVQRLLLLRRLVDPELQNQLLREAGDRHGGRCPWCYALVPVPAEPPVAEVSWRPGRLSAKGYEVALDDRRLRPRLEVKTPDEVLFRGREPGQGWNLRAVARLLAGPLVLAALGWAFLPLSGGFLLWPVVALLLIALVLVLWSRTRPRSVEPSERRVLRYAWERLAPRMHPDYFSLEDSAFVAGLALLDDGGSARPARARVLPRLLALTERAVKHGRCPPGHLAALMRVHIEDAHRAGEDPVGLVARALAACFDGKFPMPFAEHLLREWETDWWSAGNLARLRILLCDRAFEAGFEVRNLLDAGHTAPALGAVLRADEPRGLAALRLLWSLRPTLPWERCGGAQTTFELAADPARGALLGRFPDLLLLQEDPACLLARRDAGPTEDRTPRLARVVMRADRVLLQGVPFTSPPRVTDVVKRADGYELILDETSFFSPTDLDGLAMRMDRWFRFAFHEFCPAISDAVAWQSPQRAAILRAWGATPCPDCHRYLLPRVGEVAMPLDAAPGTSAR